MRIRLTSIEVLGLLSRAILIKKVLVVVSLIDANTRVREVFWESLFFIEIFFTEMDS